MIAVKCHECKQIIDKALLNRINYIDTSITETDLPKMVMLGISVDILSALKQTENLKENIHGDIMTSLIQS